MTSDEGSGSERELREALQTLLNALEKCASYRGRAFTVPHDLRCPPGVVHPGGWCECGASDLERAVEAASRVGKPMRPTASGKAH